MSRRLALLSSLFAFVGCYCSSAISTVRTKAYNGTGLRLYATVSHIGTEKPFIDGVEHYQIGTIGSWVLLAPRLHNGIHTTHGVVESIVDLRKGDSGAPSYRAGRVEGLANEIILSLEHP